MAKHITLNYDGKDYRLEFSRDTVVETEDNGFRVNEAEERAVKMIPILFHGAFLMHHRGVSKETIDDIWAMIPNKPNFISALAELYSEPVLTMFAEPDAGEKNAIWGVTD